MISHSFSIYVFYKQINYIYRFLIKFKKNTSLNKLSISHVMNHSNWITNNKKRIFDNSNKEIIPVNIRSQNARNFTELYE